MKKFNAIALLLLTLLVSCSKAESQNSTSTSETNSVDSTNSWELNSAVSSQNTTWNYDSTTKAS